MEKSINELNLGDLEAVVGGVRLTSAATTNAHKIPTGSLSASVSPFKPRPTATNSNLALNAAIV